MALSRELCPSLCRPSAGAAGLEVCESLFTHLKNKKMVAGEYSVRHILDIQPFLENGELGNVHWVVDAGDPGGDMTRVRGDMVPLLPRHPSSSVVVRVTPVLVK